MSGVGARLPGVFALLHRIRYGHRQHFDAHLELSMVVKRSLFVVPLLAGCYNYAPISPSSVQPGVEVRAMITGAASDRVAPVTGTFDNRVLTGNVVQSSGGALVLEIPTGAVPNTGSSVVQMHQRVNLAPADMVSLETRKLDVARSSLLAGAIVAGAAAAAIAVVHASSSHSTDPIIDNGNPINLIPLLKFRF